MKKINTEGTPEGIVGGTVREISKRILGEFSEKKKSKNPVKLLEFQFL